MSVDGVNRSNAAQAVGGADNQGEARAPASADMLPTPHFSGDDFETALAVLMIKSRHDDRVLADEQAQLASKAQEEAQGRKLAKMRELADDEWSQGLTEGILGGVSALATLGAGVSEFKAATGCEDSSLKCARAPAVYTEAAGTRGVAEAAEAAKVKELKKNWTLAQRGFEAGGKAASAGQSFGALGWRTAQDIDRENIARADMDIERAKSAADSASRAGKQAQDDMKETMNAIRQFISIKAQAAQAGIMKG